MVEGKVFNDLLPLLLFSSVSPKSSLNIGCTIDDPHHHQRSFRVAEKSVHMIGIEMQRRKTDDQHHGRLPQDGVLEGGWGGGGFGQRWAPEICYVLMAFERFPYNILSDGTFHHGKSSHFLLRQCRRPAQRTTINETGLLIKQKLVHLNRIKAMKTFF